MDMRMSTTSVASLDRSRCSAMLRLLSVVFGVADVDSTAKQAFTGGKSIRWNKQIDFPVMQLYFSGEKCV